MKKVIVFMCSLILLQLAARTQNQNITFSNGFFHISNEKVFLKGIGYEAGAIPGQLPWEREFDEELLRFDMERVISAGFNAIRTWAPLSEQELNVISEYDVYVIMGIWIDPHGDFSNTSFIAGAKHAVNQVMEYSANYHNIIAYLIMNEPLPEHIFDVGYKQTVDLWTDLIGIIHEEHPGVPVSFSNYPGNTYIDHSIFDFSSYNLYIYNPVTVNQTHKYSAFVEYLKGLREDDAPLIITEYGLSVSPDGQGNWGYGGNTPEEQLEGNLFMYRSAIDGGAGGAFMFNYSDGWWKAGNEYVHDPHAEEWFGLIEYEGLSDKYGTSRPAWDQCKVYNRAIISLPKNGAIYGTNIPLEIFSLDTISYLEIYLDGAILFSFEINKNYFSDTLSFADSISDYLLMFRFYNENMNEMKAETISILSGVEEEVIPELLINTSIEEWNEPTNVAVNVSIIHNTLFGNGPACDHGTYWHQNFNFGNGYQQALPGSFSALEFSYSEYITEEIPVMTFSAGYDIHYGEFSKRIYDQKMLIYDGYLGVNEELPNKSSSNIIAYPNPASEYFILSSDNNSLSGSLIRIYNLLGDLVSFDRYINNGYYSVNYLKPGVYIIQVDNPNNIQHGSLKLIIQ